MTPNTRGRAVAIAALMAIAIAVTGCAGSGSASTHTAARPTQLYTVALSGRAEPRAGAPHGRGFAIIAFHGPTTVCWRFAHLHGFTIATHAAIYAATTDKTGQVMIALTGPPLLHHRGCVTTTATRSAKVVRDPRRFYINVFAARYRQGAVRGQL